MPKFILIWLVGIVISQYVIGRWLDDKFSDVPLFLLGFAWPLAIPILLLVLPYALGVKHFEAARERKRARQAAEEGNQHAVRGGQERTRR